MEICGGKFYWLHYNEYNAKRFYIILHSPLKLRFALMRYFLVFHAEAFTLFFLLSI